MMCKKTALACLAATLLLFGCASTAHSDMSTDGWKDECVGKYQFAIPEDVEIALSNIQDIFEAAASQTHFEFPDRSTALFSSLKLGGFLNVTSIQPEDTIARLEQNIDAAVKERLNRPYAKKYPENTVYKRSLPGGFAWVFPDSAYTRLQRDSRIYTYRMDVIPEGADRAIAQFLNGFRTRSLYEVPQSRGICIPYAFLAEERGQPRKIAVTFRLKEHPDIEIYFKDESAAEPERIDGKLIDYDAKEEIRDFIEWDYSTYAKRAELDWYRFRSITMAGREGKGAFMTLTREDESIDYGYVAYVKGDYKAKKETPNLMLYVMRTAANAKGKPLSKEEVLDIAEKIVASVKRRVPD